MNKKTKQNKCVIKRMIALGMACLMAVSFAGCGANTNAKTNESGETLKYEEKYMGNNETIKYSSNTTELKIEADIKVSPEKIPEINVMLAEPNEKVLVRELLQEGMRTEFYGEDCLQYSGKNGDVLNINTSGFYMMSDFREYLSYCFYLSTKDAEYNADKYSQTTDFDFMSRQEAVDKVIEKLEKCGVTMEAYDYTIYCLDYETLKNEEHVIDQNGDAPKSKWKDSWTEDDNCYYICIRPLFNDIPEYHLMDGVYMRYEDYCSPIQAVVSKDGIRYIDVDYIMQYENTGKLENMLGPQQIIDKVIENKYYVDSAWEKQEYTLSKMNLCYFSNIGGGKILNTIPVYQCYIEEKYWDGTEWGTRVNQLIIDARTGEEVEVYDATMNILNM